MALKAKIRATLVALILIVEFLLVRGYFRAELEAMQPKVVEYTIHDTLALYFPIEIERKRIIHDTIKIPIRDTLALRDTIFLAKEQKVYKDSSYEAYVSGVNPCLDSIFVFQKTIIKNEIAYKIKKQSISFGLQIGGGVVMPCHEAPKVGAYCGVGLTYRF